MLRPATENSCGSGVPGLYQRLPIECKFNRRRAAFAPLCQRQPRLRSLYRYTMCKLIAKPLPEQSVPVRSLPGSLSGINRLAAQPFLRESRLDIAFVAPSRPSPNRWSALEEASERIRGKGAF